MRWLILPYLLTLLMHPHPSSGEQSPATNETISVLNFGAGLTDKQMLDRLFHKHRYDKRVKPRLNPLKKSSQIQPTVLRFVTERLTDGRTLAFKDKVNVSMVLLSLSSPDESSLHYEVEFLMHQIWIDPRLSFYDSKGRNFLNGLAHHKDIWKPDIYILKHGSYKSISPTEIALRIYTNGTIMYTMRRHLVLTCEGDLHIFPFDSPMCTFSVESVSSPRPAMEFVWTGPNRVPEDEETGSLAATSKLKQLNAYLIKNETLYCDGQMWRGDYSCIKVNLHFTRDKWFYYTTVFVPGLILVTSSFVTFWIEWNAEPARVMLGVTTMLNFFTTSNKFRSKLPVVSNLTAMNMWDGVCMFFIYASFLEFIVVNYLCRWVQDPETKAKKRENAILDSLKIVTTTLDMKHPENAGTLGGTLHNVAGNLETRLKEVRQRKITEFTGPNFRHMPSSVSPQKHSSRTDYSPEPSLAATSQIQPGGALIPTPGSQDTPGPGGYTLSSVKKIDIYSRRIFPCAYILFVLYFFIRYHHIEGALSVDY